MCIFLLDLVKINYCFFLFNRVKILLCYMILLFYKLRNEDLWLLIVWFIFKYFLEFLIDY